MHPSRRSFLATIASAALLANPRLGLAQGSGVFRIGSPNPVTGAGSAYGAGMQKMIAAAVEAVNAAGGAAGLKFEVVAEDTQTQPQAAVLAVKKLIEINKVQALLGIWGSGESLATLPLANDANILLMNTSGAPALSVPPANAKGLSYRFEATNDRYGRAFANIAAKEGFKRPATMAFNNASGIGNTEGFKRAWENGGGKVVESVVYEPNQPSYRAELQKVLAAKPDCIVTGSYLADTTIILREWYQTGDKQRWLIPGWAANAELAKALPADVTSSVLSVSSISNEESAAFSLYDAAYRKATGQPGAGNTYAAMAWDQVIVLALAIEAAGSAETGAINAKIREIANPPGETVTSFAEGKDKLKKGKINYEGASSVLDFDSHGDVTPNFSASAIEGGQLLRKYVVKL
jgi:branched-chain amino acid transport system substrate-binding protein